MSDLQELIMAKAKNILFGKPIQQYFQAAPEEPRSFGSGCDTRSWHTTEALHDTSNPNQMRVDVLIPPQYPIDRHAHSDSLLLARITEQDSFNQETTDAVAELARQHGITSLRIVDSHMYITQQEFNEKMRHLMQKYQAQQRVISRT